MKLSQADSRHRTANLESGVRVQATACLTDEQIADFHRGALALDKHFRAAQHLIACEACRLHSAVRGFPIPPKPVPHYEPGTVTLGGDEETLADQDPPKVPAQIGPYRILRLIGRGGMGAVYEARHTALDRTVALKLLPSPLTVDRAYRERFDREARAIARLDHPNVVRATDAGEVDGYPYLALELLDGVDAARIIRAVGTLTVADVVEIARQTASGLAHLHEHAIVHRDVKPSNLMLTAEGQIKILDLGLALTTEAAGRPGGRLTGITFLGTHDYMAPEQWLDPTAVDAKVDVYGLGCVMAHMLTGHSPFGSPAMSPQAKMKAHLEQPGPALTGVPREFAGLLARMLAKDPAGRPTAAEVAAELASLGGHPHLARLLERSRLAPVSGFADGAPTNEALFLPSVPRPMPKPDAPRPAAPRGSPRWWFALGSLTALLAIVVGWILSLLFGFAS